mgnify:CR=1 FL=1
MLIKSQKDFFAGLLFIAIGLGFAWGATDCELGGTARMGPGYFPMALGALLAAGAWMQPGVMAVIGIYLALNLAYSFGLKHQPVIDIFIVASGFVLRALAGAVALEVKLSSWMFVTTLCLALYMAAIKRKQELARSGDKGRQVLQRYSLPLIERYAEMSATGALVFYSLYVMSAHPELIVSIPLVLLKLFRY